MMPNALTNADNAYRQALFSLKTACTQLEQHLPPQEEVSDSDLDLELIVYQHVHYVRMNWKPWNLERRPVMCVRINLKEIKNADRMIFYQMLALMKGDDGEQVSARVLKIDSKTLES